MPFPDENEFTFSTGISLNTGPNADGVVMTCASLDGWGSPGSKGGGQSREGAHGESPAPNPKLQARTLQLSGRIEAPTILLRQQAEHTLQAALSLDLFDLTVVDGIPLTVRAQRAGDVSRVDDTDTQVTWQAELRCPDPLRYGVAKTLTLNLPSVTGGMQFPMRFPLRFTGSTITGDGDAVNDGNETAPTVLTFTGPLGTPRITNTATGQWIQYNDTLADGEYVVLYLKAPLVALLQGTALRTGKVSTGGGGTWGIKPGTNPIAFRAASGTGTALLEWADSFQ
ncbi:hypothetical protein ACFPJ1_40735 [Kribbella qitaiheensis]|uniref:hypothetical protein n=1 Tax=Kribbella qitaiheensis TaxID=1544730 RepID=UPI00360BFC79